MKNSESGVFIYAAGKSGPIFDDLRAEGPRPDFTIEQLPFRTVREVRPHPSIFDSGRTRRGQVCTSGNAFILPIRFICRA